MLKKRYRGGACAASATGNRPINAETQRNAEKRRGKDHSANLCVPMRLCVKTGLALVAAACLGDMSLRYLTHSGQSLEQDLATQFLSSLKAAPRKLRRALRSFCFSPPLSEAR